MFDSPSFTPPHTVRGRSALVAPPPWHYAGWLLNIAFGFEAARAADLLPPAIGRTIGRPTGQGCVHFADWQATTDGSELLDPVQAQYRETIVVLEIERPDGSRCGFCPAIWVDQDVSMLRGLLQGWPKKMGSTWLTRSLPLDHPAAAPLCAGTRLGASLAVKDRRVIEAEARLSGEPGRPLGFLAAPTLGVVGFPDLREPARAPALRLLRADIAQPTASGWHAATASLRVFEHPREELSLLGDLQAGDASAGWFGLTVVGARDA
jgi:hypothetical protein